MAIRHVKRIIQRADINDFTLKGVLGKELKNRTVGVIGTGKIGSTVIEILSGFGCEILAFDNWQNEAVKKYASYVSLEEIYRTCDLITVHVPLNQENYHLIGREAFAKMRDGVVIINTARGSAG